MNYKTYNNDGSYLQPVYNDIFKDMYDITVENYELTAFKLNDEDCHDIEGPEKLIMIDSGILNDKENHQIESILSIEKGEKIEFYCDQDFFSKNYNCELDVIYNREDSLYLIVRNSENKIIGRFEMISQPNHVDEDTIEEDTNFKSIKEFNKFIYEKLNIDITNAILWRNAM